MESNDHSTLDLSALVQGFMDDLRTVARPKSDRGDQEPTRGSSVLQEAAGDLRAEQKRGTEEISDSYRHRTEAMEDVLAKRQQRLEAYTKRRRQAVPTEPNRFVIAGRITDQATGDGLPHVRVRATDMDRREDDPLGETRTDALGYFRLDYRAEDFKDPDATPETYIEVLDDKGEALFTSTRSFVEKSGQSEFISAAIDAERVPANRRIAEKVARTISARGDDISRRRRTLELRRSIAPESPSRISTPAPDTHAIDFSAILTKSGRSTGKSPAKRAAKKTATKESAAKKPAEKTKPSRKSGRPLTDISGIGPVFRKRLEEKGITDARSLSALDPSSLAEILKSGEGQARKVIEAARRAVKEDSR